MNEEAIPTLETVSKKEPRVDGLTKFTSRALRGPKKGAREQAFTWYIYSALRAGELQKIKKTAEATLMLNEEQVKELEIDIEKMKIYHLLACAIEKPMTISEDLAGRACLIRWPFEYSDENWDKYFEPWRPQDLQPGYYKRLIPYDMNQSRSLKQRFWIITIHGLPESDYNAIKARFIGWVLPDTMKTLIKLTTLLEPESLSTLMEWNLKNERAMA